ncbi:hypothetical protein [Streptomyces diastatochromogenes]|uniref:hypothetical protein n=1 Tax=Streptomyces diastatochromogenes TaxID=42236 RepID=UPI002699190E
MHEVVEDPAEGPLLLGRRVLFRRGPAGVLVHQAVQPAAARRRLLQVLDTAATCLDEKQLAAIILTIGVTDLFDRLYATTRQIAGARG